MGPGCQEHAYRFVPACRCRGNEVSRGVFGRWRWRWNDIRLRTWARMWSERRSIGQPCWNAGRESMRSIASICGAPNASSRVLMKLSWPAALLQHCGIPLAAAGTLSCASSLAQAVGWLRSFYFAEFRWGELGWNFQNYHVWCGSFSRRPNSAREKSIFRSHAAGEFRLAELHGM